MKKSLLKNSAEGFTLVELMVVVAIIGILSAIAVPNFKKYQAKSKQSEAKIQLAAVYNTEVGASSDYDTYATCLLNLGYEQPPKGYYLVGFSAEVQSTITQVVQRGGTSCVVNNFNVAPPAPGQKKASGAVNFPTVAQLLGGTTASTTGFLASAAGNIATTGANNYDVWTIDQTKALNNFQIGY